MKQRLLSADVYAGLKTQTNVLLREFGSADSASASTRTSPAQLKRYSSRHDDNAETFMPLDVALDLQHMAETPILTKYLADMTGYFLVKKPDASGNVAVNRSSADVMQDVGKLLNLIGQALNDGVITLEEYQGVSKQIHKAIVHLLELDAAVLAGVGAAE